MRVGGGSAEAALGTLSTSAAQSLGNSPSYNIIERGLLNNQLTSADLIVQYNTKS